MSWWQTALVALAVWVLGGGALGYLWFVHEMRKIDAEDNNAPRPAGGKAGRR